MRGPIAVPPVEQPPGHGVTCGRVDALGGVPILTAQRPSCCPVGEGSGTPIVRTLSGCGALRRPGVARRGSRAPSGGREPRLEPPLQRQHVGDVGAGLAVQPVGADRAQALVVRRDGAPRVAVSELSTLSRRTPAVALSASRRGCSRRPAYIDIQAAVLGSTCMAPIAPASERRSICQPDSCHDTASASWGSTPCRRARGGHRPAHGAVRAGSRSRCAPLMGPLVGPLVGLVLAAGPHCCAARRDHHRDLEVLADMDPAVGTEVVVGDQLGGPGMVADRQAGGGLPGPDPVVHDPATGGQVAAAAVRTGRQPRTRAAPTSPAASSRGRVGRRVGVIGVDVLSSSRAAPGSRCGPVGTPRDEGPTVAAPPV